MGGVAYTYDGLSHRVAQTANSIVTQYLLDVQPGLVQVLAATTPSGTDRYVHVPGRAPTPRRACAKPVQ